MAEHTDTERLDWVMDILSLADDKLTEAKAMALAGAIMLYKQGREAIDLAMDSFNVDKK